MFQAHLQSSLCVKTRSEIPACLPSTKRSVFSARLLCVVVEKRRERSIINRAASIERRWMESRCCQSALSAKVDCGDVMEAGTLSSSSS